MYISSARGSTVVQSSENMKLHSTFRQTNVAATKSISSVRPTFIFQKELHHISKCFRDFIANVELRENCTDHVLCWWKLQWPLTVVISGVSGECIPRHAWTCQWSTRSLMCESWRSNVSFVIPCLLSAYLSLSGAMYVCLHLYRSNLAYCCYCLPSLRVTCC